MLEGFEIKICDEVFFEQYAEEFSTLCREALKEHAEKGINFGPIEMTPDWFVRKTRGCIGVYAEHESRIVSFWNVKIDYKTMVALGDILAVHPDFKGKHLGLEVTNKLMEHLEALGVHYFITDTSLRAPHVVAFHKKYGCKAIAMRRWPGRNYRSVILRKAILPDYEISDFNANCRYFVSSMICKMIAKENGEFTPIGKFLYFIKKSIRG